LTRSIRDGSKLPQPLAAHIQPAYYAAIIAAEAIGNSGNTQIQELTLNDPYLTGYAFYDGATLARAVFINLREYTGTGVRTSAHVDLKFTPASSAPALMSVKRLAIKFVFLSFASSECLTSMMQLYRKATDVSGVTWGAQTYETKDARVSGSLSVQNITVAQGFDVQETEVVLVHFV
jgi:Glycosyl hydrolase family 79 C-terminal beta domain